MSPSTICFHWNSQCRNRIEPHVSTHRYIGNLRDRSRPTPTRTGSLARLLSLDSLEGRQNLIGRSRVEFAKDCPSKVDQLCAVELNLH